MYADCPFSSILNHLRGWPTGMRGPAGLPCGCFFPVKLTTFGLDGDAAFGCWPASSALAGCMTDSLSIVSRVPGRPRYRHVYHDDCSYMTCIFLKESQHLPAKLHQLLNLNGLQAVSEAAMHASGEADAVMCS